MKVAIYSRGGQTLEPQDVDSLCNALTASGITPVVFSELAGHFGEVAENDKNIRVSPDLFHDEKDLDASFDALISLGGDGTLLDTVCLVKDKRIPVLGINFGRLGFLASLGKDNIAEAVEAFSERQGAAPLAVAQHHGERLGA